MELTKEVMPPRRIRRRPGSSARERRDLAAHAIVVIAFVGVVCEMLVRVLGELL